jgi:hypothetical protein
MADNASFTFPTETVTLASQGKLYDLTNPLSSGQVEMKYMTAREEDILTNPNLLKQGLAIEKVLQALIKTPINYDDLLQGDRNGLLIAARILAYGASYSINYTDPETETTEKVIVDLTTIKDKVVDFSLFNNKNEFTFELPHSKNTVTFKLLTVGDQKAIDNELKGLKKANLGGGELTTRLKKQILSINGNYDAKTVRDFVDNYLIAKDSIELRLFIAEITPDVDMSVDITLASGKEVLGLDLPMTGEFFFPGSGI